MHLGMMRATIEVLCRDGSYPESGVMECSWVCEQFYRGVGILSLENGNCIWLDFVFVEGTSHQIINVWLLRHLKAFLSYVL